MPRGRKPWIIDEYTDRTDLTNVQKWNLRHPEKRKAIKNNNQRKVWKDWPEWKRIEKHSKKRGLLYEDLVKLFELQHYKCAICQDDIELTIEVNHPKRGVIDHCHRSNKNRELLCHHCNRALGLVKDDPEILQRMIKYLVKHNY